MLSFRNLIFMIFIFVKTETKDFHNSEGFKHSVLTQEKISETIPKLENEWRNIILNYEKSLTNKDKDISVDKEAQKRRFKKIPRLFELITEESAVNENDNKKMLPKSKHGDYLILE